MKKEYESPEFEFREIIICEDILTISENPEDYKDGGHDNFEDDDPFGF